MTRFSFERSWPTQKARPGLTTSGLVGFPDINIVADRGQETETPAESDTFFILEVLADAEGAAKTHDVSFVDS